MDSVSFGVTGLTGVTGVTDRAAGSVRAGGAAGFAREPPPNDSRQVTPGGYAPIAGAAGAARGLYAKVSTRPRAATCAARLPVLKPAGVPSPCGPAGKTTRIRPDWVPWRSSPAMLWPPTLV